MSRCKHCNKLTHSEHLVVEFDIKDMEKVIELQSLENWTAAFMYVNRNTPPEEFGMLKCGDIFIHFRHKINTNGDEE